MVEVVKKMEAVEVVAVALAEVVAVCLHGGQCLAYIIYIRETVCVLVCGVRWCASMLQKK